MIHPARQLCLALLILLLLLDGRRCDARMSISVRSLEARLADADLVIVGVVERRRLNKKTYNFNGLVATVRVEETLKGTASPSIEYARDDDEPWPPIGKRCLFYLANRSRRQIEPQGYDWIGISWRDDVAILLEPDSARPPKGQIYTIDYVPIDTGEALLAKARGYCKTLRWQKPAQADLDMEDGYTLAVPLDDQTLAHARQWAGAVSPQRRRIALDALAHYKLPAVVALVKSMLADPGYVDVGHGPRRSHYYLVRDRAASVLQGWSIPIALPVIEDGLTSYQPANIGLAGAIALASCLLVIGSRRLRRRAIILVSLLSVVIVTAGWLRSTGVTDEWVIDGKCRRRLTSSDQHLQYLFCRDWSGLHRFVHGAFATEAWMRGIFDARVAERPATTFWSHRDGDECEIYQLPSSSKSRAGITWVRGACMDPTGTVRQYFAVRVHYGLVLVFPGVLFIFLSIRTMRKMRTRRHRLRHGLCLECGYDLRAGSERCPECGTPPHRARPQRNAAMPGSPCDMR